MRGVAGFEVLAMDIDRFEAINDTYGHDAGDAVLRRVAEGIGRSRRTFSSPARPA